MYMYLEDSGATLAEGWEGGTPPSSSKNGLNVCMCTSHKRQTMRTWLEPDVHCVSIHHITRLTLTFTHHKLTLVCVNDAPIYTTKHTQYTINCRFLEASMAKSHQLIIIHCHVRHSPPPQWEVIVKCHRLPAMNLIMRGKKINANAISNSTI